MGPLVSLRYFFGAALFFSSWSASTLGNFNPMLTRFIESQKEYHSRKKRGMRWKSEDIKFAVSIWYKSPSTYEHLGQFFGLPSLSVIYEKLKLTMATAGICPRTLEGLRYKVESMNDIQRTCAIALDGMKLQACLQYMRNDVISGFEELEGRRTPKIATELEAVMIQGIASHWKQVKFYKLYLVLFTKFF